MSHKNEKIGIHAPEPPYSRAECPRERFLTIISGKLSDFFADLKKCLLHTIYRKTRLSRAEPDREIFTW